MQEPLLIEQTEGQSRREPASATELRISTRIPTQRLGGRFRDECSQMWIRDMRGRMSQTEPRNPDL